MLLRQANRVPAVAGLGDDLVPLLLEECPETLTNAFMVVGKEDSSANRTPPRSLEDTPPRNGAYPREPGTGSGESPPANPSAPGRKSPSV